MTKTRLRLVAVLFTLTLAWPVAAATGSLLDAREYAVTATPEWETTPRLGNDGISDIVTFTRRELELDGTMSRGDIWYQRLDAAGAPMGAAVQVTNDGQDNQLNDISGDYIVYTAYDSTTSLTGHIMAYQISTRLLWSLGAALVIQEPRIHGMNVVWREGGANATQVMLYDLAWIGSAMDPAVLAGPIPPTYNVDIGERFVVWAEQTLGQLDVVAFDLVRMVRIDLTSTLNTNETEPSTDGDWIAWQAQDKGVAASRIVAARIAPNGPTIAEQHVLADEGVFNYRPSISGDLVAWESMLNGNLDVFIHRFSTHETFQITTDLADQYLNDIFGNNVSYVDQRTGNEDVYVTVLTFATPPVANAGPDQEVHVGGLATLDGSASSDPHTLQLTYAWRIVSQPNGPLSNPPELTGADTVNPTFRPFNMGSYQLGLVVTNTVGLSSPEDIVVVSTTNAAPIAEAGPDQSIAVAGVTVQLDGHESWDPNGDALSYEWTLLERPAGSLATIAFNSKDPAHPTFVADVIGTYRVQLVVSDNWASSEPDTVTISSLNLKPEAVAATLGSALVGEVVTLDGSGSHDANGDPLTYLWSMVSAPASANVAIEDPAAKVTRFVPDVPGSYVVQLVVNDGSLSSDPSPLNILVLTTTEATVELARELQADIAALPTSAFTNRNHGKTLQNKLNAVIKAIQEKRYVDALDQLETDILPKVDGCANSSPPAPDKGDWFNTCADEALVYPTVLDLIANVVGLM